MHGSDDARERRTELLAAEEAEPPLTQSIAASCQRARPRTLRDASFGVFASVLATGLLATAIAGSALAHGDAAWIQKKHPRCCGEHDCHRVSVPTVMPVPGGYTVSWRDQMFTVGEHEALRSVDSDYWVCEEPDGRIRCLFVPVMGS